MDTQPPIRFPCPDCHRFLRAAAPLAGRSTRCPNCYAALIVPVSTRRPDPSPDDTEPSGYVPLVLPP